MTSAHEDHMYIDYSCSTSVERLARDVEVKLREWHVADGADFHISFEAAAASTSASGVSSSSQRTGGGIGDSSGSSNVHNPYDNLPEFNRDSLAEKMRSTSASSMAASERQSAVRLIRSADVVLGSFPLPCPISNEDDRYSDRTGSGWSNATRNRIDVELTLALWDGPPRCPHDSSKDVPPLPQSLRRRCDESGDMMPPSITSDLCALLGIGQHITLTPRVVDDAGNNESILGNSAAEMLLSSTVMARYQSRTETDESSAFASRSSKRNRKGVPKSSEDLMDELHGLASLSSLLQSALNFAVSACDCRVPAFGIWAPYNPRQRQSYNAVCDGRFSLPFWLAGGWARALEDGNSDDGGNRYEIGRLMMETSTVPRDLPTHQVPTALSGRCHPGPQPVSALGNFEVYAVPPGSTGARHLGTLHGLAAVLQSQMSFDTSTSSLPERTVSVVGARHFYRWERNESASNRDRKRKWSWFLEPSRGDVQSWRISEEENEQYMIESGLQLDDEDANAIIHHRVSCERHALKLLERATALGKRSKHAKQGQGEYALLWGPEVEPVVAICASATWNASSSGDMAVQTALQLKRTPPKLPLVTLPLKTRSSHRPTIADLQEIETSLFSAVFDPRNAALGAFELGVQLDIDSPCTPLSASNRCILAGLIKVSSLDDETLVGHLSQRSVLEELHNMETELDQAIRNPARQLMGLANVGEVTRQLFEVLDWKSMAKAKRDYEDDIERALDVALEGGSIFDGGIPFPSPPEVVFRQSRALRDEGTTPAPAMDLSLLGAAPPGRLLSVYFASLASLRTPSAIAAGWLAFVDEVRTKWDRKESLPNIGSVAGLDDGANAEYSRRRRIAERSGDPKQLKRFPSSLGQALGREALCAAFVNSTDPDPNLQNCLIAQKLQIFNVCVECMIGAESAPITPSTDEDLVDNSSDDGFYDAVDDPEASNAPMKERIAGRKGVRCPVHGASLVMTGDQLYAPYLQRPEPLSKDQVIKRRAVLTETSNSKGEKYSIQERLDVAFRMQRPKLISDMKSFKAANPGACFEDFVSWYGNPSNPLDEYADGERCHLPEYKHASSLPLDISSKDSVNKASEAIHALTAIRNFWYETWQQASPSPASAQEALFDPEVISAVAMHSLETIHPSYLFNQILAVNISSAVFILHSEAGITGQVPVVKEVLDTLGDLAEKALLSLAEDRAEGWAADKYSSSEEKFAGRYVSIGTVASCEATCNVIGEAEIIISRAMSLLSKFPGNFELVHDVLVGEKRNSAIIVDALEDRSSVLDLISENQNQSTAEDLPLPSLQEYVLENDNEDLPCRLTAKLGTGMSSKSTTSSAPGVLIALSRCGRT